MHRTPIGPTGAAMENPMTRPFRNWLPISMAQRCTGRPAAANPKGAMGLRPKMVGRRPHGDGPRPVLNSRHMTLGTLFLILLVLLVIGAIPTWPHSRNWGYYPSGGLGIVLVILILLMVTNRI